MQAGRYSRRIRAVLPESVNSLAQAQLINDLRVTARTKKRRDLPADAATVDYLFPAYLEWYGDHRAPTSLRDLKLVYNAHISRILGVEKILAITTENLDYYQQVRLREKVPRADRNVKPRTVNKELNYFSGFLKWCRRHKKINIAPVYYEKLSAPRPRPPRNCWAMPGSSGSVVTALCVRSIMRILPIQPFIKVTSFAMYPTEATALR